MQVLCVIDPFQNISGVSRHLFRSRLFVVFWEWETRFEGKKLTALGLGKDFFGGCDFISDDRVKGDLLGELNRLTEYDDG
jgi:hypothetical protein